MLQSIEQQRRLVFVGVKQRCGRALHRSRGKSAVRSASEIAEMVEDHLSLCDESPQIVPSICSTSFHTIVKTLLSVFPRCASTRVSNCKFIQMNIFRKYKIVLRGFVKPIEFMADIGILGDHLLLHHATLVTDREIELLQHQIPQ